MVDNINQKEYLARIHDEIDRGLHDLSNKYEDGWDEDLKDREI